VHWKTLWTMANDWSVDGKCYLFIFPFSLDNSYFIYEWAVIALLIEVAVGRVYLIIVSNSTSIDIAIVISIAIDTATSLPTAMRWPNSNITAQSPRTNWTFNLLAVNTKCWISYWCSPFGRLKWKWNLTD